MLPERHGSHLYSVSTISQGGQRPFQKNKNLFLQIREKERKKNEIPNPNAECTNINYAK